ncbi:MAG: Gfo/Idh/MocA family protein, partial [Planctomycetaceae bacterium]
MADQRNRRGPHTTRRRSLLQGLAVAAGGCLPWVASTAAPRPSRWKIERPAIGAIGLRYQGSVIAQKAQAHGELAALCDVDRHVREQARAAFGSTAAIFEDYREMLARKQIDVVLIGTPDHWHAKMLIDACRAGMDVYCEKPLANSVLEGRAMVTAANRAGKIIQCGSQERSTESVRLACEQARNGKLGKLHTVEVHLPTDESHHLKVIAQKEIAPVMPVPEGFDYDGWLGFTPWRPFRPFMPDEPNRGCHFWWRFNLLYGGGEMTDRGAHIIDLAQLALGKDDTGPVSITAQGRRANVGLFDA